MTVFLHHHPGLGHADRHQTVWTCKRCCATKRSDEMGDPGTMDPFGPQPGV